ncbi:hypothetical protein RRG08_023682 [Elysia crispata]|uniref:Uncharacterized protein n=1 Tax=Elysia crispata TaxID=231223 RepID=A0AAE1E0P0_9GAST|nr:hypothetical protein RRG08_023682 [Elysia crispata]
MCQWRISDCHTRCPRSSQGDQTNEPSSQHLWRKLGQENSYIVSRWSLWGQARGRRKKKVTSSPDGVCHGVNTRNLNSVGLNGNQL